MFQVTVIITTIYYSLVGKEILYGESRIQKRLSKELIIFINNVKENHYTIELHWKHKIYIRKFPLSDFT